jgi:hypothetical protein
MQMRAGTQTLIQALQALPWSRVENDDDIPDTSQSDSSDEDDSHPAIRKQFHHNPRPINIAYLQNGWLPQYTRYIAPWPVHVSSAYQDRSTAFVLCTLRRRRKVQIQSSPMMRLRLKTLRRHLVSAVQDLHLSTILFIQSWQLRVMNDI